MWFSYEEFWYLSAMYVTVMQVNQFVIISLPIPFECPSQSKVTEKRKQISRGLFVSSMSCSDCCWTTEEKLQDEALKYWTGHYFGRFVKDGNICIIDVCFNVYRHSAVEGNTSLEILGILKFRDESAWNLDQLSETFEPVSISHSNSCLYCP